MLHLYHGHRQVWHLQGIGENQQSSPPAADLQACVKVLELQSKEGRAFGR